MPPKRSSSRTQPPAQRRPRTERACNHCRHTKQRCEPIEYGMTDRPCRRCVSQGLDCSLPRVARSQSPSSGLGAQVAGPSQDPITPPSAGGATEELALGSGINVRHTIQQSESVQGPMRRWSPFMMHPEEQQGSSTTTTILPQGQTPLQTSFLPAAPGIEGYQQSFPNVAQDSNNPESSYYPDYYGTPSDTYIANYATQGASDGAPNLGYTMESTQCDDAGSVHEQDPSGES